METLNKENMVKIALDAMGGDYAPKEIVEGANLAINANPNLFLTLYGKEEEILKYLKPSDRVKIVNANEKLDMGEKNPVMALRSNKELSIVKAFQSVKDKENDGVVTCGPTQGVVVAAHMIIKKIPGMQRIALCPQLPVIAGKSRLLLDVGANVELRAEHIVQIAHFASTYVREVKGIDKPVVGLVNIGTEAGKGRELDHEVYDLLTNDPEINFFGNIEPKEMLYSDCDVLVTDGFSGNLVLKTIEGTASVFGKELKAAIKSSFMSKIGYLFMKKQLNNFKKKLSGDDVGGALIFGVDGVVVKSHGASDKETVCQAIENCMRGIKSNYVNIMKEKFSDNANE